jgi:hypothetical protein
MQDISFPITVPCSATASSTVGATCALTTSFDSIVPGAAQEGVRAVWQLGGIQVFDGGSDGVVSTAPNALFERAGVFVP